MRKDFIKISFKEFVNFYKIAPEKWQSGKNFSCSSTDDDYIKSAGCNKYTLIYTAKTIRKIKGDIYQYEDYQDVRYFFYVSGFDRFRLNHFWRTLEKKRLEEENNKLRLEVMKYLQEDINSYRNNYIKTMKEEFKKIKAFQEKVDSSLITMK